MNRPITEKEREFMERLTALTRELGVAREFMRELTKLTRRYGIAIWGCGCCGSPKLVKAEDVENPKVGYDVNVYDGVEEIHWATEEWQEHERKYRTGESHELFK